MTDDPTDLITNLVREAVAAPPASRVRDFRDRIAAHGGSAVGPLMQTYEAHAQLRYFVVAVLCAIAKNRCRSAVDALEQISATNSDRGLVRFARDALRSLSSSETVAPTRSVIERINEARRRRGEPELDAAETRQVVENLARRSADPRRYRNVCWYCGAVVTEDANLRCDECEWLVCWCGACREPRKRWPPTYRAGPCPIEAGYFGRELNYPDCDFRGRPIMTANPPAKDVDDLRRAMEHRGVAALFHWTPSRSLQSILRLGVLSRSELAAAGLKVVSHGYGSREKRAALSTYVALSFRPKVHMMTEWSDSPVVLEIHPVVALGAGTLFVPGNSASAAFSPHDLIAFEGARAFERVWPTDQDRPISQAEVWVRTRVPRRAILRDLVPTVPLARELRQSLTAMNPDFPIDIAVDPSISSIETFSRSVGRPGYEAEYSACFADHDSAEPRQDS